MASEVAKAWQRDRWVNDAFMMRAGEWDVWLAFAMGWRRAIVLLQRMELHVAFLANPTWTAFVTKETEETPLHSEVVEPVGSCSMRQRKRPHDHT